jgi:hypothetical protein
MPYDGLEEDIKMMKAANINVVRINVICLGGNFEILYKVKAME